ncbi:MAG: DNA-processing protein DprA [Limnohabitans sp.]
MTQTPDCMPTWESWVRLQLTPGVGPQAVHRLLQQAGSPEAALACVREAGGARLNRALSHALEHAPADWRQVCDRISDWLAAPRPGEQHALWTPDHPQYPAALREIPDPPLCLFVRGQCRTVSERCVALVGSRNATRQGLENAKGFAQALAERGWCVVSGLALGIDGAAHQGALASQQAGGTLAVVGTGLDHTYPAQHRLLADEIASRSVLLSELMPGTPPLAFHFPRRNRIIAGLSQATVVVEASLRSGSLITAQQALEQGRDVMAVPGSIHATQSRGCHALLNQGAKLVESIEDILVELRDSVTGSTTYAEQGTLPLEPGAPARPSALSTPPAPDEHRDIWEALGLDPAPLETLCLRIQQETAQVLAGLLALELGGWVERLPGGRFQRVR